MDEMLAYLSRARRSVFDYECKPLFEEVIVFGAGGRGVAYSRMLLSHGIKTRNFIDNDANKIGSVIDAVGVIALSDALKSDRCPIIVSSCWCSEIAQQLFDAGVSDYYFDFPADVVSRSNEFTAEYISIQRKVIELLCDKESRDTFSSVIEARVHRSPSLVKVSRFRQYRHPKVMAVPGDIILDCGAMWGESALDFLKDTNFDCKVYSFEPSPAPYAKLLQTVSDNNLGSRITPVEKGVSDVSKRVMFSAAPESVGGQRVDVDGDCEIELVSIDEFALSAGIKVDMIKMDIEGEELSALYGAANTIKMNAPKLMIAIYHAKNHLHEIPRFINHLNQDYKMYIGHHMPSFEETILYATV